MDSKSSFDSQTLEDQAFKNIVCTEEDLSHKEFSNCTFEKCDFSESIFTATTFIDCYFKGCNLSNAKVDQCGFQGVIFDTCKLLGVKFSKINTFLIKWSFKGCLIELCDFSLLDIRQTPLLDSTVQECDFINTNLSGSDFTDSDLRASRFQNTNLEKTNFLGARNYYIDPTSNKIKQARFAYPDVLGLLAGFDIKVE